MRENRSCYPIASCNNGRLLFLTVYKDMPHMEHAPVVDFIPLFFSTLQNLMNGILANLSEFRKLNFYSRSFSFFSGGTIIRVDNSYDDWQGLRVLCEPFNELYGELTEYVKSLNIKKLSSKGPRLPAFRFTAVWYHSN